MTPRGAISLARTRGPRSLLVVVSLLGLAAAGVVAPVGAVHAATVVAPAAAGETTTFADPARGSALTVEVTPGDSSTWRQGDIITVHVSGMTLFSKLKMIGTCPADMPPVGEKPPTGRRDQHVINPDLLSTACGSRFSTAIPGGADLTGDTPALSTSVVEAYGRKDGTLDVSFRVGSGEQQNTAAPIYYFNDTGAETQGKLTCDETHRCAVGFELDRGDGSFFSNVSDLAIAPAKASSFDTGSCTGLDAAQTLTAIGPERLQTPLSLLDRGFCGTHTSPIPVSFLSSEIGEAGPTGVSTVGTTADLAFIGSPALTTTPLTAGQVAIPIAINAAAVGQTGGISSPSVTGGQLAYNPATLPRINLAPSDVAGIILHSYPTAPYDSNSPNPSVNPLGSSIAGRPGNEGLAGFDPGYAGLPFGQVTTPVYGVGQNSVAVSLSNYLLSTAAGSWVYPDNAYNSQLKRVGKPVGALTAFDPLIDLADTAPHLTSQMSSINSVYSVMATKDSPFFTLPEGFTSVCPLSLDPSPFAGNRWAKNGCVRFVVLDAASATSVGLDTAGLGSGTSADAYVAPSADTMGAAATAASGTLGGKGYFETTAPGAYPLTFVEYAVVSTNALVDDACAPRTAQQKMLRDFLSYTTTTGQAALPAGLAGLTPDLAARASAAIAKIGTTTVARCTKATAPATTPTPRVTPTPPPPVVDNGVTGGGSSGSGGDVTSGSPPAAAGDGASGATGNTALGDNAKEKPVILGSKQVALQDATFSGASRASPVSAMVGLLVLLVLVGVGAAWAAGALVLPGLGSRVPPGSSTATGGGR